MLVYVFINTTNRKFYGYNLFLMKAEWNYLQEMRMRMRMNDATAIYSRIVWMCGKATMVTTATHNNHQLIRQQHGTQIKNNDGGRSGNDFANDTKESYLHFTVLHTMTDRQYIDRQINRYKIVQHTDKS